MKTKQDFTRAGSRSAFTIPEFMIAMTLFIMASGLLMSVTLYGVKRYEVIKPKLGLNDSARISMSKMITEVRQATAVNIGNVATNAGASFVKTPINTLQQGNALQIINSTNTNDWVLYYVAQDPNHRPTTEVIQSLLRRVSSSTNITTVAAFVSNRLAFTAEDYTGTALTNNYNNRIVGLALDFYELRYPRVPIGPGRYYDFYRVRTKIMRRGQGLTDLAF